MEINKNKNKNKQEGFKPNLYWLYAILTIGIIALNFWDFNSVSKSVKYSDFQKYVEKGYVTDVLVITNKQEIEANITNESVAEIFKTSAEEAEKVSNPTIVVKIPSADSFSEYINSLDESIRSNINISYDQDSNLIENFFWSIGPFLIIIIIWVLLARRMGGGGGGPAIFNVGKSKAQLFEGGDKGRVTFKDVAGLAEAKQEVQEIVEFLKNPKRYTNLGGKIPKGALLVGPPGTGKTLLAKAVAGEANVPFFSLSGSDFVEMFVGVGASRVRDLFRQAKEKSPCIIFIDEIDAVGRARGKNPNMSSNDERENTLNQLLTEMDGFGTNSGVIILAATNRADILDKALLRAGRFDRQIHVELPDIVERKEIFQVHLRPLKLEEGMDIDFLSKQTPGFSGADIANVCNEAALIAARKNKDAVQKQDFLDAVDRIIGGLERKNKIMTKSEKRSIAIHESGHATISWLLEHANPLVKVTIVPRGKALGAAWYLPEERQLTTKEQMLDEICAILGGRAAEEVFLSHISTGALNDLERVTKQAFSMITYYGMSNLLPNICYYDSTGQSDFGFSKPYSEDTAKIIDAEVKKLIEEQYERAKNILKENAAKHNELANLLVEREVIFSEDLERIFGKRPWGSRTDELIQENNSVATENPKEDNKEEEVNENSNSESKNNDVNN
ncbi:MAG: ATP-dependent zinc metalloprotease FtsH [Paludibacteraceae bacterium]|nr:ATP-dependent zinc metalloprotease FtsH [Paludibacteraceae bacterium]